MSNSAAAKIDNSPLGLRVRKMLDNDNKPNFLWYLLLITECTSASEDDRASAAFAVRTAMQDQYQLSYPSDDANYILYGEVQQKAAEKKEDGGDDEVQVTSSGSPSKRKKENDDIAE